MRPIQDEEYTATITSQYYDINELKDFLKTNQKKLTIFSLNIQSLNSKFDIFSQLIDELYIEKLEFSILCLQEAQLSPGRNYEHLNLEKYGYNFIYKPYSDQCSVKGGLAIYLKNYLCYNDVKMVSHCQMWEGLFLNIKVNKYDAPIIIGNIYRPPKNNNCHNSIDNFLKEFKTELYKLIKINSRCILCGDLNIDFLKLNSNKKFQEYYDLLTELSFIQTITIPTRLSNNPTLIDHIYLKCLKDITIENTGVYTGVLSDHMATFLALNLEKNQNHTPNTIYKRYFSGKALQNWFSNLSSLNWETIFPQNIDADPNSYYNLFSIKLDELFNTHFPVKKVKLNKYNYKRSPWMTNEIINKIKERDKTYKKLMKAKNDKYVNIKNKLKELNIELKRIIRQSKFNYYKDKFNKNKLDMRKTWNTINEVLNKTKDQKGVSENFNINGKTETDKTVIADQFNKYFIDIGPELAKKIGNSDKNSFKPYLNELVTTKSFKFTSVDENDIRKIINKLKPKTSSGVDNISTILLKLSKELLIKPIATIINQSLTSGIFPNKLKVAKVLPIYKKEDPKLFNNYRPISLLPAISKVFEKVAHIQLTNYMTSNNLLFNHQYGFREGHSTELALLEFIDRLYNLLDNKKNPIAIFLDLSKAFDTIDHNILLYKLNHYGIKNVELKWFESYLRNRSQCVEFEGVTSQNHIIKTGVPQGSILGPLLFLIYVNDLYKASDFHSIMFADDTTLMSTFCNLNEACISNSQNSNAAKINTELDKVYNWLAANKLSLNISKTKYMIFSIKGKKTNDLDIKINNTSLEQVNVFKFLGVHVDSNLSWNTHITYIANKLSRVNGILCRLKHSLPTNILKTIYCALFLPHLYYGICTWGFATHSQTNRLIKLQKKAVRNISKSKYNAHTAEIFKMLNIHTIPDVLKLTCIKIYYRYTHNTLPNYFVNLFQPQSPTPNNLRPKRTINRPSRLNDTVITDAIYAKDTINVIHTNTLLARSCFKHKLIQMINNNQIPDIILNKIHTHTYYGVTNFAKNYYKNQYKTICLRENCPICITAPLA